MLGFVNVLVELQPLFTESTRVFVVGPEVEPYKQTSNAVAQVYPSIFGLLKDMPMFERLEIRHYPIDHDHPNSQYKTDWIDWIVRQIATARSTV